MSKYDQMQNLQIKRQIVLTEQISKNTTSKEMLSFFSFFPRKSQQIVLKKSKIETVKTDGL